MQSEPRSSPYFVWVLQGAREGDNAQARALAGRLSAAVVLKRLAWSNLHVLPNVVLGAGLASIDKNRSDSLSPPWPDAVIAVGRRSAPVAVWIKAQSKTRLIHLGRPRFPLARFDLVITTPQYALPEAPNVLRALLPVTSPSAPTDKALWRARFAHLPKPWTGVLVGGTAYPFHLGAAKAREFAQVLARHGRQTGGSLLISTSPRTGDDVAAILAEHVGSAGHVHRWSKEGDNPHRFILSEADSFIVTEDSASMLAEACRTGRPVLIHEMPRSHWAMSWRADKGLAAGLARSGLLSPPRNIGNLRDEIIRRGHARMLGDRSDRPFAPYVDEWDEIARRIDALVNPPRRASLRAL